LRLRAELKKLTIEVENPTQEILTVVADKEKTKQIIINLVSNAIQYTEQGGIRIQFFKEDHTIKIAIIDTGIGIKLEDQALLFQKFQTVEGRFIHSKEYGSSMGLYISKLLAESMKGSVAIEESTPGKGSTFVIRLPSEN
jgi:two-component system phosphate regulon sensor histidine kinase PhoR